MLYYSIFNISDLEPSDIDEIREKIKNHFTDRVNLKSTESLVGKALLCMLVKRNFGLKNFTVDCAENGKPYIVNSDIRFNISHSDGEVLCVCGDENVGCDIQRIKPYNEKIAGRFFTAKETELLEKSVNKAYDFTVLWALKESALKYSGEGLSGGLDRYDFSEYYDKKGFCAYGMSFCRAEFSDYIFTICCSDTANPTDALKNDKINENKEMKGDFYEHH